MKRSELRQTALDIKTTMGAGAGVALKAEDVLALLDDADELAGLREGLEKSRRSLDLSIEQDPDFCQEVASATFSEAGSSGDWVQWSDIRALLDGEG
jgi:hypothetical protein